MKCTKELVDIEDIKKNGISPKSKLFWALISDDYVVLDDGDWIGYEDKPKFWVSFEYEPYISTRDEWSGCNNMLSGLKVNYTRRWQDSLHFRGDYE